VIIGNGGAAFSAVRAIRSVKEQDEIVLISEENCPSYSTLLTPYYISGRISYDRLFLCDRRFYQKNKVNIVFGKKAVRVVPCSNAVYLEDGSSVDYDKLLIATGASPKRLRVTGTDHPRVYTLRTLSDAKGIIKNLKKAREIIIIGGGLVSLKMAEALFGKGRQIIFVVKSQRLLTQNADPVASEIIQKQIASYGLSLLFGKDVKGIKEKGGKIAVIMDRGQELNADLVIIGKGIVPNTHLMEGSGVKIGQGIVINKSMRTNIENIFAAGDVAEGIDSITGKPQLNATWLNAIRQGWTAGLNMAGKKISYLRNVRTNISNLFGLRFASAGLVTGEGAYYEEVIDKGRNHYRKLVFDGDLLVGTVLIGDVSDVGVLTSFIERREIFLKLKGELHKDPYSRGLLSIRRRTLCQN